MRFLGRHATNLKFVFPHPSPAAWAALAGVLIVDAVWFLLCGHNLSRESFSKLAMALMAGGLLVAVSFYCRGRSDLERIAAWSSAMLFFVPFSLGSFVLSYLATSLDMPLIDIDLAAFDHAIGFDWLSFLHWVNQHPAFGHLLATVYFVIFPQLVFAVLILAMTNRIAALRELIDVYLIGMLAVIFFSGLTPAAGAYLFHAPSPSLYAALDPNAGVWHVADMLRLREGSFHTFNLSAMQGIIVFPSFHTALAVLTAWSLRSVPFIRFPAFVLNGLVVISTLPEGGHYLADVLAGIVLVAAAILARRLLLSRRNPQMNERLIVA